MTKRTRRLRTVTPAVWVLLACGVKPAAALTITPYFTSAITGAANAAQIEGAIDNALGTIDGLYSNSGTVGIVFTQEAGNFLGESDTADYSVSYSSYTSVLTGVSAAEPTNTVLATAVANLASGNQPGAGGSVILTSADARVALGQAGFTGCFNSAGTFQAGCGQVADGVVILSSSEPLNYTKTPVPGQYSAIDAVEHEVDEILGGGGQGSVLNEIQQGMTAYNNDVGVLDLYRYSAPGTASFTTSGGATSYFSVDGGKTDIVGFNQNSSGDYADFSPNNDVQSAFSSPDTQAVYDSSSPEFAMMESIGYDGIMPEPASMAVMAAGVVGLGVVRRRRARK